MLPIYYYMLLTRRVSVTRTPFFFPFFFQLIFGSVFFALILGYLGLFFVRVSLCVISDLTVLTLIVHKLYILLLSALRLQLFHTRKQQKLGLLQEFGS
jgi:hypothetical protein